MGTDILLSLGSLEFIFKIAYLVPHILECSKPFVEDEVSI